MLTRTYRYVSKEVIIPFWGGFFFFMFIFLMFQVLRLADDFINHGASPALLAKMTVYISAAFLPVVLPVSFLMAVLVGFGRMSADSEIVALQASGISMYQLYFPICVFSILVATAVFYLTYYFIPWGNHEMKRTLLKLANTKVVSNLREGTFTEGFFDLLIYSDKVDTAHNKLNGVFIYDERDQKNPVIVLSKTGDIIPLKTDSDLASSVILRLNDGNMHRSDILRNYYEKIDFSEYRLFLKVEEGQAGDVSYPKTLSSPELQMKMHTTLDNSSYQQYAIEYWKRIALSICPLLFGILGVGLGVVRLRSVKSNAVLIAFGVVVLYWGLQVVGENLAEKGTLPSFLAMQLSNISVLPFAIASFKRSIG